MPKNYRSQRPLAEWTIVERLHIYRTRADAPAAIFENIKVFYNRRRMHSLLDYMTPDEFDCCTSKQRVE